MNYYLIILGFLLVSIWGAWQYLDLRTTSRSYSRSWIDRWGIIAASTTFLTISLNHLTTPPISLILASIVSCSIGFIDLWGRKLQLPRTRQQQRIWSLVSLMSLIAASLLWRVQGLNEFASLGLITLCLCVASLGLMTRWIGLRTGTITGIVTVSLIAAFQIQGTFTPAALAASQTFAAGAYIIDLGQAQTVATGLKPYGLVYDLVIDRGIPVKWAINPTKAKDGVDFTVGIKDYKGSAFIIPPEYATAAATTIATWTAKGVVVDGPLTTGFTAPIFDTITSFPNAVIDNFPDSKGKDNSIIPISYYTNAEIPALSSSTGVFGTFNTYRTGLPSSLTSCDDLYIMPHADPTWTTHKKLLPFNQNKGFIWAACHAVSVLENLDGTTDPTLPFTNANGTAPDLNFLSGVNGLVPYTGTNSHTVGSPPYTYSPTLGSASPYQWLAADTADPIAQFMGTLDAATQNGSEQIYLPQSTGWRSTTKISVYDPTQSNVPTLSPGPAAVVAYGRGFGSSGNGMVMYESGHNHDSSATIAANVAAQRAFFNFILLAGIERRPNMTATIPSSILSGSTVNVSATGGTTYKWASSCGGTFASGSAASTTFTAPTIGSSTTCSLRVAITDVCSRRNFDANAVVIYPQRIVSGTVFEDANYGGGVGRSLTGSSGVGRGGATIELYDSTGLLKQTTTTSSVAGTLGQYSFTVVPGDYTIRVVNSTVTSARTGYVAGLLPVQTFRTMAANGTVAPVIDRVGGEQPTKIDPVAGNVNTTTLPSLNTGSTQAQSVTPIVVTTSNLSGLDFGYNFDTIVNTNDSGQGSLRQFIINSNALTNTGLAQVGQTAGTETSIFTISNGAIHNGLAAGLPNQLSSYGAAVITLTSTLPTITDSNTIIDGATQTANIGNTNAGTLGTGGTVGTEAIPLPLFDRPEVEIAGGQTILTATGDGDQIKNIAANLHLSVSGNNSLVQDNLVGMQADGTIVTALNTTHGITVGSGSGITVRHNYVRVNDSGIRTNGSGTGLLIEFNEVDAPPSNQTDTFEGILFIGTGSGYTMRNNLISNMRGAGTELSFGGVFTSTLLENNTYLHNGYLDRGGTVSSTEPMGIVAYNASAGNQLTISKNIITQSAGPGIVVMSSQGITMTQNSLFANGISGTAGLGIDLDPISRDPNGYLSSGGVANGVTANGTTVVTAANNGMNYPVITSSKLSSGQLTVKGFVGSVASSNAFTGAKVEVFIAANDGNQNGAVIFADGRIKSHGEGKTYLPPTTACTTDSNSQFSCTFSTAGTLGLTDPKQITATATDNSGNTSEFSASPYNPANVQILKRITGIKSAGGSYGTTNPNNTAISLNTPDNTNASFPTNYVTGISTNAGIVKPGDEIEYTIYYVNNGENAAKLKVCDLLSPNLVFNSDGFDTGTNTGHGIQLQLGQNTPLPPLTSANDSTVDRAYYASGAPGTTISGCNVGGNTTTTTTTNASGTVVIDINSASASDTSAPILLTIPGTVGSTIPNDSYGLVKFRAKVKN